MQMRRLFIQMNQEKKLNMVFHFDHMHLDYDENGKYATNRVPLVALKKIMTQWQDKMLSAMAGTVCTGAITIRREL